MFKHFENCIFLRFDSNICQNAILRVKKFTETLKEHHMTGEFALIFVFNTEKHVIKLLFFIGFLAIIILSIFEWSSKLISFHSDRIKYSSMLPGVNIFFTKSFSVIECLINESIFLVLFGR